MSIKDDAKKAMIGIIRPLWDEYNKARVLSVLKDGKWKHLPLVNGVTPPAHIDGTRAETRSLKAVMGFPEYLELRWKTK